MMGALVSGHGINDRFHVIDLFFVDFVGVLLQSGEWTDARQHPHQALQRSHLPHLA